MKKGDSIFSKVKWHSVGYFKRTYKFELELPKIVKETVAINEKNRNTPWQDAMKKDMENVKVIFQTILKDEKTLKGFSMSIAMWCLT